MRGGLNGRTVIAGGLLALVIGAAFAILLSSVADVTRPGALVIRAASGSSLPDVDGRRWAPSDGAERRRSPPDH